MTPISNIWKQLTSILSNMNNFHSLEVVDRVSETQLQVGENSDWIICQLKCWLTFGCWNAVRANVYFVDFFYLCTGFIYPSSWAYSKFAAKHTRKCTDKLINLQRFWKLYIFFETIFFLNNKRQFSSSVGSEREKRHPEIYFFLIYRPLPRLKVSIYSGEGEANNSKKKKIVTC